MATRIPINSDLITWAIHRAGYELNEFLAKFPRVQQWINQEKQPTVKQLENFSKKVHLPFGYLLLDEPPQESLPIPFFRTQSGVTDQVSLNVYDTIQLLKSRQEWLSSYLQENDYAPLEFVGQYKNAAVSEMVNSIRKKLDLAPDWAEQVSNWQAALNLLAERTEEAGIVVTFNSVVGNNTSRPISVEECRGFVLVDKMVPFLFINAADAKAAQMFTLVHELAHVWIGESAGFDQASLLPADVETERLCDKVAAEFLVPAGTFTKVWREEKNFKKLGEKFKVSPIVVARRALDLQKISKAEFFGFYNNYLRDVRNKKEQQGGGGDFYATAKKRVSLRFAAFVNRAVQQNELPYREAYKLTNLKGETYRNFVEKHLL